MDHTAKLPSETLCYLFRVARLVNPILTAQEIHSDTALLQGYRVNVNSRDRLRRSLFA